MTNERPAAPDLALLNRAAWRDPQAYDAWLRAAAARSREIVTAERGRTDLSFDSWLYQVDPSWPWHYRHLQVIRERLARVATGECRRLMIFLHPRSFKSQMVTVRFPAYLLERDPLTRIVIASYAQNLAESFSYETRKIVATRGEVKIDPRRQMVDEWLTAAGGGLKAVGVGGGITGRGANCFPGETPVLTESGPMRIDELARMERPPQVVSYDFTFNRRTLQTIVAAREREAGNLIEIVTFGGKRIRCTPEHRLLSKHGWLPAGLLYPGASLLCDKDDAMHWEMISAVRHVRTSGVPVYDIQAQYHHNFFAGGILAHNCMLIDDPVRSYQDVRSAAFRDRVWHWWQSDILHRLEPHPRDGRPAAIILIMTRWHPDDLAGRILAGESGPEWDVLRIPALAETQEERDEYNKSIGRPPGEPDPLSRRPGEAMNPERFDEEALADKAAEGGVRAFSSLYQQRPTAPEGEMFRREWFEIVSGLPEAAERRLVRYWDKAGSRSREAAYTAGALLAVVDGTYYVVDCIVGKWEAGERERIIRQTAAADDARYGSDVETGVEQEPGSGGLESADNTVRGLAGYRAFKDRPTGDKTLRAEPLAAQAAIRNVKLVAGAWNGDYIDYLTAFPNGPVKDPIDASSGAFARLVGHKPRQVKPARPVVHSGREQFE